MQQKLDVIANDLLIAGVQSCQSLAGIASEEIEDPLPVGKGVGDYLLLFDPLDGSSIVDTNFSVGTIFGVWPGDKLKGITGRDQAAAGMGVFGPRTVYVIALKDAPGCHEFLLQDDGKWMHVKETTEIGAYGIYKEGQVVCRCFSVAAAVYADA